MKKALAVLLSVLMLATLIAPTLAYAGDPVPGTEEETSEAGVVLKITADKTEVKRGDSVTVTVTATKNVGWFVFIASTSFDSGAFAQNGNVAYGSVGTGTKGTRATIDAGDDDTTETGVYFSYTLSVLDNAPYGEYTVGVKGFDISNSSEETVTAEADTATVKVVCTHEGTGRVDGNVVAATCVDKGSKEIKCAECGAVLETQELALDPNNHKGPLTSVAAVDSTCHTPGHAAYTYCEACSAVTEGSSADLPLNPDNHTGEGTTDVPAVPATCSAPGTEAATACAGCGIILSGGAPIQQLEHNWSDVTYTWSKDKTTCTASRTCSVGQEIETETVTASSSVVENATCEHPGVTQYTATFTKPAFVQQTTYDQATPAALNHAWGTVTYTWSADNATCTATRFCNNDSHHVQTEKVTATSQVKQNATCTDPEITTFTATFQNEAFTTQNKDVETAAALHHAWGDVTYTWSADNTTCTATRTCTRDASHVETETVNASSSVVENADCLNPGVTMYTATFTKQAFVQQTTYDQATPAALGHAWGEAEYNWDIEAGEVMATHVCTRDPHHKEFGFAKIVKTVTKAPTAEEEGEYTLTATFENSPFETQTKTGTIDKLEAYELEEKAIDYTVGTDKDATITVKEAEGDFMPETLAITDKDGKPVEVTDADYTYENGKLTLKESFASKLAAGTYKVTFQVGEKGVLANVEVKAAHSTATGDTAASLIVWSFVALVSLAGAVVMTKKIRASK